MYKIQKSRGFTIIELVVTMVIVGILAAVAMPNMQSFIQSQRGKAAATDLFYTLLLARSEALKRNADIVITPATGGWNNGWVVKAGTVVLDSHEAVQSITITNATSTITYNGSGRLVNGASSFEVTGANSTRCVNVDASGRPNNTKGAC